MPSHAIRTYPGQGIFAGMYSVASFLSLLETGAPRDRIELLVLDAASNARTYSS